MLFGTGLVLQINLLLELSKFAEMSGDVQQKADLQRQYEAALKETTRLAMAREQAEKTRTLS